MKNKRGLFTGYYGYQNTGDDIFVLVSAYAAKKYWKNIDYKVLSDCGPISESIEINYDLNRKFKSKVLNIFYSYYSIIKTNTVTLCGGSILGGKPKTFSPRWFIFLLMRMNLIKVNAIGVSVGPFKSEEGLNFIKNNLKYFQFLVLRDKVSYEITRNMNLPYNPIISSDLAFMLPKMFDFQKKEDLKNTKKILGISVCHYERYYSLPIENEKRREVEIFNTLNKLKENNIEFHFFVINGNSDTGDEEYTRNLIEKLQLNESDYKLHPYEKATEKTIELIHNCDLVLSTRLHGAIVASAINVPSLLIEYHRKCTDYLDDMNIDEKWRIGDMNMDSVNVLEKINFLLNNPITNFYPNRDEKILAVSKNFTDDLILKIQR